jgi:hypothetical protein
MILEHLLDAHKKGVVLRLKDLKENGYGKLVYAISALKLSLPDLRRKINITTKLNKREDGYWNDKNNIIKEAMQVYEKGIKITSGNLRKMGYNSLSFHIGQNWNWKEFRELIKSKQKERL